MPIPFDNTYSNLPERFYSRQSPVPVAKPELIRVNEALAKQLGIDPDWLASAEGVEVIAGNQIPQGADPIATVYAGHQFGGWNPQLGDGRAILLGEVIDRDGERFDIQLKGSGRTAYSRGGDGRAPLGPVLREYLVSEAMAMLGVPTSRTLAAVTSGEPVFREAQQLAGGVLVRVAKSHIRIGTMQYLYSRKDVEGLQLLTDHIIQRHYAEAATADNPVLTMFEQVMQRQVELICQWQALGFIHGVMNTDNMLLSGETIDYGPCAFMDQFEAAKVFSSIDVNGRYAYNNQPAIANWNLAGLAQTLLPLLDDNEEVAAEMAQASLDSFHDRYLVCYLANFSSKLGLTTSLEGDELLIAEFLDLLEANQCDFTLAFRRLNDLATGDNSIGTLFDFPQTFQDWIAKWQIRLELENADSQTRRQLMNKSNPVFIPRNHLVEQAISEAYAGDFAFFHRLYDRLMTPFSYDRKDAELALPPTTEQVISKTFCGT
jgi:uncharacterized protein YdiU (UPF0061 family)